MYIAIAILTEYLRSLAYNAGDIKQNNSNRIYGEAIKSARYADVDKWVIN